MYGGGSFQSTWPDEYIFRKAFRGTVDIVLVEAL